MSNLSPQLGASSTAPAQEMPMISATTLTAAPPPSAWLASYSQPTQQLLLTLPNYQNSATVFGTIEEALQSIIPNINMRTSTDPKVKPSSNKAGTPAYCIDQLLDIHNMKLSPDQRVVFLASKNYTAKQLYSSSPLNSVLQEFYSWEDWNNYWKDRRGRYKKGGANNAPNVNIGSNDTHVTCYIDANYFKKEFETDNLIKFNDEFYPSNVLICPFHSMPLKTILPHGVTHFLTQKLVLVTWLGTEKVVVFNAAEFASNTTFVEVILGALSFTCSSSVFVITEGDDGEMLKCELTIKGKTPESIHDIAHNLYTNIVKQVKHEKACVGIVHPAYLDNKFTELGIREKFFQDCGLNDRYQHEGVDTHLQDSDGIKLPPAIIVCSNPRVIVSEHIKLGNTSIFDGKVLIWGSDFNDGAFMHAFNDETRSVDHDCVVERYGRMFGKPMGFCVETNQLGSESLISFLINAPDALSGTDALTCVASCLTAVGPSVIADKVTFENVHEDLIPLPLRNEDFKSLVKCANDTDIEFLRFTISNDLQEAMGYATASLTFVDCSFEQ